MAVSFSNFKISLAFNLLILACIGCIEVSGQKNLSGNVRDLNPVRPYSQTHVKTIGADRVTVDDLTGFAKGDTILLIQMQGIGILKDPPAVYGSYQQTFGFPGMHEFLIIDEVNGPDEIVFKNNIFKAYVAGSSIQIVRVPYYNTAQVTGKLYCDPWNSTTRKGGVMAIIIGKSLDLKADIDVSGLGLNGGAASIGTGKCAVTVPVTDSPSYPVTFNNAGFKGEGIAIHDAAGVLLAPDNVKGEGPNYTGGGGGNGKFSGGGGGSNRGVGGTGGYEESSCPTPRSGGWFGKEIDPAYFNDRIFLGGGGGASSSLSGLTGAGGNGGGIVIIVTDNIFSSGGRIIADGGNGGNGTATSGAGGGGGGGSIAVQSTDFGVASLVMSAKGGDGGVNTSFGSGGGGGGGLVYINKPGTVVNAGLEGGQPGIQDDATSGSAGEKLENFKVILNGFLFNSIRSSVTGNQTDSICSNGWPANWSLTGTTPIGGTPGYTYTWQKKYEGGNWTTLVSDNSSINYTPTDIETDTVHFRRIITDSTIPVALTDTSKEVMIIVQTQISGNVISPDSTICFGQDPSMLISKGVLQGGNHSYSFDWRVSTNNTDFNIPGNTNNTENYSPLPDLTIPIWYRRTVTSGRCIDSTAISFINVLDTIQKNRILNDPADICNGMIFVNLQGSTSATPTILAGGDNIFRFRWEASINGSSWANAPGTVDQADYDPAELPERIPSNDYYFRRVVYSGANDVCSNTSNTVLIKDFPVIDNNTISSLQDICSGSVPALLAGSDPVNGDGTYAFEWQDSSKLHIWTNITGATGRDYQPPVLTDTTWYRRNVYSSACSSTSNSVRIIVHKPVINNTISLLSGSADTTICNAQDPNRLVGTLPAGGTDLPGSYVYQWLYSLDNTTFNPVPAGGSNIDFDPAALTATTYYRRQVTSGECTDISSTTITVNVLPLISGNTVSSSQTICYNTNPAAIAGTALSGGVPGSYFYLWEQSSDGGTVWTPAADINSNANYSPPALTIPMSYRRIVTSGPVNCCSSTSNIIEISIHPPLPTGAITNLADTTICGGSQVLLKVRLTGTGPWTVTYRENTTDIPRSAQSSGNPTVNFVPASPSPLNTYNYALANVQDANGCLAISLSGSKNAIVYKVPVAFAGADTAVCGPVVNLKAVPTVGTGSWTFPSGVAIASAINPVTNAVIDSTQFANGFVSKIFTWEETNWQCTSADDISVKFYQRVSQIFAGPDDTTFYSNTYEFHLVNNPPVNAWETGIWTHDNAEVDVTGGIITDLKEGDNSFLWTIYNGIMTNGILSEGCMISDALNIKVRPVFVPQGFSPNSDSYNNTFIISGLDLPHQSVVLKIFNSVGTEVFSTHSTPEDQSTWTDWEGKSSSGTDLPEGTYYYFLTIGRDRFKGFVILKRY